MSRSARWRPARAALPIGLILGVVASGAMVWQASEAAFTAQTSTANHIGAGTVVISNERSGQSLLSVTTLTPGATAVQCVLVTYSGSATATVKLYANTATYTDAGNLGNTLTITVETADTGAYGNSCATFAGNITTIVPAETADTFAARNDFSAGAPALTPWQPTGTGQSKAYRVTATLPANAATGLQGTTLDLALIWEAQSV
jgi:hypothetical protein